MTIRKAIDGFKMDNLLLSGNEEGIVERNILAIEALESMFNNRWIPVAERLPTENEYRVVCAAHSGKLFLRRFEVAYITDTTEYQFGYYDGYKWINKSNKEISNVVAWKKHEPFNQLN